VQGNRIRSLRLEIATPAAGADGDA